MIDEKEIRKTIALMNPDDDLFEVRIVCADGKILSGYFKDADILIQELKNVRLRKVV